MPASDSLRALTLGLPSGMTVANDVESRYRTSSDPG